MQEPPRSTYNHDTNDPISLGPRPDDRLIAGPALHAVGEYNASDYFNSNNFKVIKLSDTDAVLVCKNTPYTPTAPTPPEPDMEEAPTSFLSHYEDAE